MSKGCYIKGIDVKEKKRNPSIDPKIPQGNLQKTQKCQ